MFGSNGGGPLNSFALVSYLPDPLADFIDDLRHDVEPACVARAHITILPPRLLSCAPDSAWTQLRDRLHEVEPFRVELEEVKIFGRSDVIYISIGAGYRKLLEMHQRLDSGHCRFSEAWDYHPHITLAQTLEPSEVAACFVSAAERWREYAGPRSFWLDRVAFVQNTWGNRWQDLHTCELAEPVLKRIE
jgi:2'-5' RNA ligase